MKKQKNPRNLRQRLYAALSMLLIATILLGTASYAWLVLSIAPEVTGITTNIGANGSLEIALLNTNTKSNPNAIRSGVIGESLVNSAAANETWGNLIDLSDAKYGLNNLVLLPARLNAAAKGDGYVINGGYLAAPTYGYDGRVVDVSKDTISAVYRDSGEKGFYKNGVTQDYGVRAIGTSDSLNLQGSALAEARGNIASYLNSAKNSAVNATNEDLFMLLIQYAMGADTFGDGDIAVIAAMVNRLANAESYIERALRQGMVAFAASKIDNEDLFEVAYDKITDASKSLTKLLDELDESLTSGISEEYKKWVAKDVALKNDIDTAKAKCAALNDGSYTAEEIRDALGMLMNTSMVYIGDDLLTEADTNELLTKFTSGEEIALTLKPGSGAFATIADFTGNYTCWIRSNVSMKTASAVDPAYLADLYAKVNALTAAGGNGDASFEYLLNVTYGYALDLAFRCNAETSELLLQTAPAQRVFDDSSSAATLGGGSYMEFDFDGTDYTVKELIKLMDAIRVAFVDDQNNILGIARLNVSNRISEGSVLKAPLYLYDYTIGTEGDELGVLLMNERQKTENAITTLEKNVATALTALVWLDGDLVDNTMVPNSVENAPAGILNLQFASSADLVPAGDKGLQELQVSKDSLTQAVATAKETYDNGQGLYTTASWKALEKAYNNANAVLKNEDATMNAISRAVTRLNNAREALALTSVETLKEKVEAAREFMGKTDDIYGIVLPGGTLLTENYTMEQKNSAVGVIHRVDYSNNLHDEGQGVMTPIYTDESWEKMAAALYDAEYVYYWSNANPEALPGTLRWDTSITALEYAQESLQRNVYYEAYSYNGAIYYMAISDEPDTYGKWYYADFTRVVSDLTIIDLDAYATRIEIAELMIDEFVSDMDLLNPEINVLDEVYPSLRNENIIAADWDFSNVFDRPMTAENKAALETLIADATARNIDEASINSARKLLLTYENYPVTATAYMQVASALQEKIHQADDAAAPPVGPELITTNQRVVLAKAILEAKAVPGFVPPAEPDPENPEAPALAALRTAVAAAEALTESSTKEAAAMVIDQLNDQLEANGKQRVTEENTITYDLPEGADTFEVVYDYNYPSLPLVVDLNNPNANGQHSISGIVLTESGVISRITATTTVYTPADGAEFPVIFEDDGYPEGGNNDTYIKNNTVFETNYWDHKMYSGVQYQLPTPELIDMDIPAISDDGAYIDGLTTTRITDETIRSVIWSSGDTDILTVDEDGLVTSTGIGTTNVYALVTTVQGSEYTASMEITVYAAPAP